MSTRGIKYWRAPTSHRCANPFHVLTPNIIYSTIPSREPTTLHLHPPFLFEFRVGFTCIIETDPWTLSTLPWQTLAPSATPTKTRRTIALGVHTHGGAAVAVRKTDSGIHGSHHDRVLSKHRSLRLTAVMSQLISSKRHCRRTGSTPKNSLQQL